MGVIDGDYSKYFGDMLDLSLLVVSVSASWEFFRCWIAPESCLMETTNSTFFRSGEWGLRPFSYFRFFGGADAPTIVTDQDHPLPPLQKFENYFLWITISTGKRL